MGVNDEIFVCAKAEGRDWPRGREAGLAKETNVLTGECKTKAAMLLSILLNLRLSLVQVAKHGAFFKPLKR